YRLVRVVVVLHDHRSANHMNASATVARLPRPGRDERLDDGHQFVDRDRTAACPPVRQSMVVRKLKRSAAATATSSAKATTSTADRRPASEPIGIVTRIVGHLVDD